VGSQAGLEFKAGLEMAFNVKTIRKFLNCIFNLRRRPGKVLNLAGANQVFEGSRLEVDNSCIRLLEIEL